VKYRGHGHLLPNPYLLIIYDDKISHFIMAYSMALSDSFLGRQENYEEPYKNRGLILLRIETGTFKMRSVTSTNLLDLKFSRRQL
jgi:hypothetical protein